MSIVQPSYFLIIQRFSCQALLALAVLLPNSANAIPSQAESVQTASAKASEYYESALSFYHKGEEKAALIELKNSLQIAPDMLAANILVGEINLQLGNYPAAEVAFQDALKLGADITNILPKLAETYLRQWRYEKVLKDIQPTRKLSAIEAEIHVLRGRAHLALGELDEASATFTRAGNLKPSLAEAFLGQADVALRRGQRKVAEELLEKALSLSPENPAAWHLKAELLRAGGFLDRAISGYDKAVKFDPERLQTRVGRAVTFLGLGRDEEALLDLELLLERVPDHPHVNYLYAKTLRRKNDLQGAERVMRKVDLLLSSIDPKSLENSPPTLLLFGLVRFEQKNLEQAYYHSERFYQLNPGHQEGRKLFARVLVATGERSRAISILTPLVVPESQDLELFVMLGDILLQLGSHEQAQLAYRRALNLMPNSSELSRRLAESHALGGDDEQAMALLIQNFLQDPANVGSALLLGGALLKEGDFKRALLLARRIEVILPENPLPVNLAGVALLEKGELSQARTEFENALRLDPEYLTARLNLAKIAMQEGSLTNAENHYRAILDRDTKNTHAIVGMAKVEYEAGDPHKAREWLETLDHYDPQALPGLLQLVELYFETKEETQAYGSLQKLTQELEARYPTVPKVFIASAKVALLNRDQVQAQAYLERAAKLARPDELVEVAKLQMKLGDYAKVQGTLLKAIKQSPEYLPAHIAFVQVAMATGNLDAALDHTMTLKRELPEKSIGNTLLGDLLMAAGQADKAAVAYEAALQNTAKGPLIAKWFEAKRRSDSLDTALDALSHWASANPDDPAIGRLLAFGYLEIGQLDAAREAHEKLLALNGGGPQVLNNLAWLCSQLNDPRALDFAKRAYQQTPESAASLDTLGWILVKSGETESGLGLLREAYVRAPSQPAISFHLAMALKQGGRDSEATEYLKQAVASKQEFEGREEATGLLHSLSSLQEK